MALTQISLARFRNHSATTLDDTRRFNLLIGENGAGKTNVLEAISLLAPGRGLRRAMLPDMAEQRGAGGFAVGATLQTDDGGDPVRLGTQTEAAQPTRRLVRINSAAASALALGEWLSLSWLTPAMDRLFTDSAGARRRFLDRMALALDPAHAGHASRYEAALRERNRLLSDAQDRGQPADPQWLSAVEPRLAEHGAMLAQGRARLVGALMEALSALPAEPFARPALTLVPGGPIIREELIAALATNRPQDQRAGRTLIGPHRDELEVRMAASGEADHSAGMEAARCSTGEQKAMLIAITLAHAELAARGRPSLLLLDEVAAHLDPVRRTALFARLREGGAQVWLTGTESAPFADILEEAAVWRVGNGVVERV
ncbi:DNA replication and repair protein RecF [Alteripontixanthobacter maritimus]|uniref:DNA replication and repair protein RecF n=1 Tax=Alteripontixanthobacter maritimus TaxID=2161824 RepID=A0A369Q504_9SPHN|nr:DNA replication/repair protein RecF [Alteripontixanthobacter maritimus]RDC59510.1 DNA replication and repair protein RecF [Alteripontixanthobacter maritimus]